MFNFRRKTKTKIKSGKKLSTFLLLFSLILSQFLGLNVGRVQAAGAWYNLSWNYRIKITVDHTKVDNTLTDFPVFVDLSALPSSFFSNVRSDGGDIRVTKTDKLTEVARQVLVIDTSTKTGSLYIKASSLSSTTDTNFYIYYGNSSATEPTASATYGSQAVWSKFKSVFLARNVSGTYIDETGNTSGGTATGTVTNNIGGITGRYITVADSTTNIVTMGSINTSGDVTAYDIIRFDKYAQKGNSGPLFAANFRNFGTGNAYLFWRLYNSYYQSPSQSVSVGDWHTNGFRTKSGDGAYFYLDGTQVDYTNTTDALVNKTGTYNIGGSGNSNQNMSGDVAGVFIADSDLGADWMLTKDNNFQSPSTFYMVGNEELGVSTPDAPTSLATTSGNTQVTLSWTAPLNDGGAAISDYVVDYKLNSGSVWTTFADGVSATTTATVTGLTNGTLYDFRVSAINSAGQGAASILASATPATVPSAPTSVSAVAGNAQATISFTASSSNGGSAITVYTVTSSPGGITATGSASPITITGLTNGTAYTFTVTATNAVGTSPASAASSSVTPATVPDAPTTLSATYGNSQVALSWIAPSWNGGIAITDYAVEYKLNSGSVWTTFADGVSATTTATVTGLTNGTLYDFRVSAINSAGQGAASILASATPATVPSAPTSVSAVAGNTQATISFTAPSSNGGSAIISYRVISSPGVITATGSASPITVTGLTNGTSYTFTVIATNAVGDSSSSSASLSVTPATTPDAPTSLTATSNNSKVSLSWTAPANNGGSAITDYIVDYKLSTDSTWITFSDGISTLTSAVVTGLTNGLNYDFRVSTANSVGLSSASSVVNATPVTVPDAPIVGVDWYDSSWNNRIKITVDHTKVTSTLTDFPVYVDLSRLSSRFFSHVKSDGGDIRVTSSDATTEVARQVLSINTTSKTGSLYIKASSLSSTTDTIFYIYYGNSSATEPTASATYGSQAVWSKFKSVFLARNISGTYIDETGNTSGGTATGTVTNNIGGITGRYITVADSTTNIVTMGSINTSGDVTAYDIIRFDKYAQKGNSGPLFAANFRNFGTGNPRLVWRLYNSYYQNPVQSVSVGDWHTNGFRTKSGDGAYFYLDGTQVDYTNTTDALVNKTGTYNIGGSGNSNQNMSGDVAGVFIADSDLGADWMLTKDNNFQSPSTFYMVGNERNVVISTSAVAGNAQAIISFSDPDSDGGSAITSYTVTSSPGNITATGSTSPIIVTGLTNGVSYTFTVTATNAVGTSVASDPTNAVIPKTVPDAPTSLAATPGDGQVGLSWVAPSDNGGDAISDYGIEYKLHTDSTWTTFADGISATTTATVTGLTNGLAYDFRVSAINAAGQGIASSEVTGTPVTVPDPPTIGTAVAGNAEATVSFTAPTNNGGTAITSYTVTSLPGGFTATGSSSPITVTSLTNGTAYTFTVTATNAVGTSSASAASNSVTPITVPSAPTAVSAVGGNAQATISFTAPASNGGSAITSYTVTSSPGSFTATGTSSPITVTGLTKGTAYTFTVTATNAAGTSVASNPSSSITLSIEPDAPTNLAAAVLGSSIQLAWSAPAFNGGDPISDYIIQYQLTTGGTWSTFSDGTSATTGTTVTGLINSTSYDFRVSAVNTIGQGVWSSTVTATPGEPAQVLITNFSNLIVPTIGTKIKITNEGSASYEYQYSWCITDSSTNDCGGNDDVFDSMAAKLIQSGQDFDTTLNSTVPTVGSYWFHINVAYGSEFSSARQSFTAVASFPDAPVIGTASAGDTQATVSFSAPASDHGSTITSYTVTSSPGGITATGSSSPITVTGLTNGTAYTFTVTATNGVGIGPASAPSNSVTPLSVPSIPTGLVATAGNTQVDLSWVAPSWNGGSAITDYIVEYKLNSDSAWTILSDGISTLTTATVTGLTNGLTYNFQIRAVNILGSSAPSSSVTATPVGPVVPPVVPPNTGGGSFWGGIFPPKENPTTPENPDQTPPDDTTSETETPEDTTPGNQTPDTTPDTNQNPSSGSNNGSGSGSGSNKPPKDTTTVIIPGQPIIPGGTVNDGTASGTTDIGQTENSNENLNKGNGEKSGWKLFGISWIWIIIFILILLLIILLLILRRYFKREK